MLGKNTDISATQRIEQAIGQCETLSILPAVASRFLTQLTQMELTPSSMAELMESDPALMVLALRLCRKKAISVGISSTWIQQMLVAVTLREIRDAVLSATVYGGLAEDARTTFRRELTKHSLAVACCAEQIAKLVSPAIDGATAYHCGLLHDIGKFLLDEVMPKSFDTLLEQARTEKSGFRRVEQENLGLDHTILGKRFAQKLRLPSDIILGIWLHHSQTGTLSEAIPQARIAAIVELADYIVRRAGIGESGSFDEVLTDTIADTLGLTAEQITQVESTLPGLVLHKSEVAGLTLLRPGWTYCDALRAMTSQLTTESAKLNDESTRLQSNASYFDFIRELMPRINSTIAPIEMAEHFAIGWQRFYQTGPVCVYLTGEPGAKTVEAVVVENQTSSKTSVFEVPEDAVLLPPSLSEKFAVVDVVDYADWLLEQSEVKFDLTRTKMAPLQSTERTVGVILFELRHPINGDISQRFAPAAGVGAMFLDMLDSISRQQWFAERFAQLLTTGGQKTEDRRQRTEDRKQTADAEALAEMAAGAAHELNNPLSVISGRAQLLAQTETDPDKKRILGQIQQNASELSTIIDDLMSYANPPTPKPTEISVSQIIDEAIDLASIKTPFNRADIKIDIQPNTPNVYVDSAQIACAVSNIICNGLESYEGRSSDKVLRGQTGPLTLQVSDDKSAGVAIRVVDSGRGMDAQTIARATQPFFSTRPAGRKRGMGLAHSQRLIQINGGSLSIASQQGKGTTVAITLPRKQ